MTSYFSASSARVATTFTVTLSPVSGRPVTVDYATADGTATAPGDSVAPRPSFQS